MTDRDPETVPIRTPSPPPPSRPEFEFRQRPSTVVTQRARAVPVSYGLWLAAAGLILLAALLMVLDLDGLQAGVRGIVDRDFPRETAVTRDRAVALTVAVLIGTAAVTGLVEAAGAMRMRAGRGAARFGLLLLLALSAVEIVVTLGVVPATAQLTLLLSAAFALVAAVFMYLPAANGWFASRRR